MVSVKRQRTIGRILIWLGVLAWTPYIYIRLTGGEISLLPFLIVHLTGVISGGRLSALARRRSTGQEARKRNRIGTVGRGMILLGVLAWAPYFYLKQVSGVQVEITWFLASHLTGVLGGIGVLISPWVIARFRKGEP